MTVLHEPRTLGQILDQSFRIAPKVLAPLMIWLLPIAAINVALNVPEFEQAVAFKIIFTIAAGVLGLMVFVRGALLAGLAWDNAEPEAMANVGDRISFSLYLRIITLALVVAVAGFLWCLLLIIPGIIYWVNRLLASYILVLEDGTVSDALKKSKYLMTRESWYRLSGPMMRLVGISLLLFLLNILASALFGGATYLAIMPGYNKVLSYSLMFVGNLLMSFVSCVSSIIYIGFYFDLRARYEGADILRSIEASTVPSYGTGS